MPTHTKAEREKNRPNIPGTRIPEGRRSTLRRQLVQTGRSRGLSNKDVKANTKAGLAFDRSARSSRRRANFFRATNKTFGFLDRKKMSALRSSNRAPLVTTPKQPRTKRGLKDRI